MANRPLFTPTAVIVNGNMASSISGSPTIINWLSIISYQVSWAGTTPVGNLMLETSNDYSKNPDGTVKNAGNWIAVPLNVDGVVGNSIPITGNTGGGIIDVDLIGTYAVRLSYSATSGTGLLQAIIAGKVS